jgi:hypothetical protein
MPARTATIGTCVRYRGCRLVRSSSVNQTCRSKMRSAGAMPKGINITPPALAVSMATADIPATPFPTGTIPLGGELSARRCELGSESSGRKATCVRLTKEAAEEIELLSRDRIAARRRSGGQASITCLLLFATRTTAHASRLRAALSRRSPKPPGRRISVVPRKSP